jgi:hypothetical protein
MSDDSLIDAILAIILNQDGSLRYDQMSKDRLEALLPPDIWEDSGLDAVLELSSQWALNTPQKSLDNIGLELINSYQKNAPKTMIDGVGISNGHYATPSVAAIGMTISNLERLEPQSMDGEMLIQDPDGGAVMLHDILELEICCHKAGKNKKRRESCRHLYWKIWELAWTRRIFVAEDHSVEVLEDIYVRYPFLDTRSTGTTKRNTLTPGNLPDPLSKEDVEPDL